MADDEMVAEKPHAERCQISPPIMMCKVFRVAVEMVSPEVP